jgi:hypothetical protein
VPLEAFRLGEEAWAGVVVAVTTNMEEQGNAAKD